MYFDAYKRKRGLGRGLEGSEVSPSRHPEPRCPRQTRWTRACCQPRVPAGPVGPQRTKNMHMMKETTQGVQGPSSSWNPEPPVGTANSCRCAKASKSEAC